MKTDALTNPIVRAAIEALQNGNRKTWSALFEPDAELYDDGSPGSLKEFTRDALGHERFTSIDRVENNGLDLTGAFHSDRWGDFLNAYAEGYFRRLLAPRSMPATWALDWRRSSDCGRHYNQVFSRALAGRHAGQYVGRRQ